jgi:NAD(P)-dependent dehydrogenase (short-subunit alcohol dehydrogenase family)
MSSTALVVGASRGLGLGLAAELRRRGWAVVATARDEAGMRRIETLGARAEQVDITDDTAVAELRRRLDGERFDLVFVNAGISPSGRGDALQVGLDEAARLFVTNAIAPARLARRFLDRVRDHGTVAFMSSGLGSVADNSHGYSELYSASKAALNSLARSLAATIGRPITVLAVAPGWVRTDMGGPGAPLSIEQSTHGIVDMLQRRAGTGRHGFVDQQGREVAW